MSLKGGPWTSSRSVVILSTCCRSPSIVTRSSRSLPMASSSASVANICGGEDPEAKYTRSARRGRPGAAMRSSEEQRTSHASLTCTREALHCWWAGSHRGKPSLSQRKNAKRKNDLYRTHECRATAHRLCMRHLCTRRCLSAEEGTKGLEGN